MLQLAGFALANTKPRKLKHAPLKSRPIYFLLTNVLILSDFPSVLAVMAPSRSVR